MKMFRENKKKKLRNSHNHLKLFYTADNYCNCLVNSRNNKTRKEKIIYFTQIFHLLLSNEMEEILGEDKKKTL